MILLWRWNLLVICSDGGGGDAVSEGDCGGGGVSDGGCSGGGSDGCDSCKLICS